MPRRLRQSTGKADVKIFRTTRRHIQEDVAELDVLRNCACSFLQQMKFTERTGRYTRKLAAERSPRAPSMQQPQVRGCLRKEETGLRPLHVGVNKSRRRRFRGVCWILKSERVPFLLWAFVLRLATSYWFFSSTAVSILATWLTPQF